MYRYHILIEYVGTNFVGWQIQKKGDSVQRAIQIVISKILKENISLIGSGRTDAGVHSKGQVAHVDILKKFSSKRLMDAINAYLLDYKIKITEVKPTIPDAHARFSAISREYEYVILNRYAPPALDDGRVWHQRIDLDIKNMKKAANYLVGTHDFTSYRATQCQSNSPIKTLDELSINKVFDKVFVRAKARSFLHHQVRNIVGTLKLVGSGKWDPEDVLSALEKKDRAAAGPTAPACGLTLINIEYPKEIYL